MYQSQTKEARRQEYLKFRERYLKNAKDQRARITREKFGVIRPDKACCEMCGDLVSGGKLHLDHDHNCRFCGGNGCPKCFRGWLCSGCNHTLGFIENGAMERALAYLRRWKEKIATR